MTRDPARPRTGGRHRPAAGPLFCRPRQDDGLAGRAKVPGDLREPFDVPVLGFPERSRDEYGQGPVRDSVTREMLTAYYMGLHHGLGRGDALRLAQLAMLSRQARRHPFYWASFIQAGEWASLDGRR